MKLWHIGAVSSSSRVRLQLRSLSLLARRVAPGAVPRVSVSCPESSLRWQRRGHITRIRAPWRVWWRVHAEDGGQRQRTRWSCLAMARPFDHESDRIKAGRWSVRRDLEGPRLAPEFKWTCPQPAFDAVCTWHDDSARLRLVMLRLFNFLAEDTPNVYHHCNESRRVELRPPNWGKIPVHGTRSGEVFTWDWEYSVYLKDRKCWWVLKLMYRVLYLQELQGVLA